MGMVSTKYCSEKKKISEINNVISVKITKKKYFSRKGCNDLNRIILKPIFSFFFCKITKNTRKQV